MKNDRTYLSELLIYIKYRIFLTSIKYYIFNILIKLKSFLMVEYICL